MAFDTRRQGLQKRRNLQEQTGDVAQLNRISPQIVAPTRAGTGRAQRISANTQRDILEGRTLDARRFGAQNVRANAGLALQERGFEQAQENRDRGFDEGVRQFDVGRSDRLNVNRNRRFDNLVSKGFNPDDVSRIVGRGETKPQTTGQPKGAGRTFNQPQTPQTPQGGGIQLRRTPSAAKPADLKGQYNAVASDFVNAGIDESELYDAEGKETAKGKAALQFMMRGMTAEQAAERAQLSTKRGNLEAEAGEISQWIKDNSGLGEEVGTVFTSSDAKEKQARLAEIQELLKTEPQQQAQQQPRSFAGGGTAQPPQQAGARGFARPQQAQEATPRVGRSAAPGTLANTTTQQRDLSSLSGQEGRVGNKNGVDGVYFKDAAGKQTFYSDNEIKSQFPEVDLSGERSATGTGAAGDPITFRAKNITMPGSIQQPGQAGGLQRPGQAGATQAPRTTSRGEASTEGDKLIDSLEAGGISPSEHLEEIDNTKDRSVQREAAKNVRAMLDNPDRYKDDILKKYIEKVDIYSPSKRFSVSARQTRTTTSKARKDKVAQKWATDLVQSAAGDRQSNLGVGDVISDILTAGKVKADPAAGKSEITYDQAFRVYQRMEKNKGNTVTKLDFDAVLQPDLISKAIKYFEDKSKSARVEEQTGERLGRLLRSN
jgi:hypothetical protein